MSDSRKANGGTADYASKLQTYKSDGSGTYGSSYPLYAKWTSTGDTVKLLVDDYTILVDKSSVANSVIDTGKDGSVITFSYNKAGLDYSNYSWLAAWNGTELRAVSKNQFLPKTIFSYSNGTLTITV